jgi:hypothetical protein
LVIKHPLLTYSFRSSFGAPLYSLSKVSARLQAFVSIKVYLTAI